MKLSVKLLLVFLFVLQVVHAQKGFRMGPIVLGSGEQLMEEALPVLKRLLANPRVRMPRDVMFTHRSLGGMYSMARQLSARVDYGEILLSHVHHGIAQGKG